MGEKRIAQNLVCLISGRGFYTSCYDFILTGNRKLILFMTPLDGGVKTNEIALKIILFYFIYYHPQVSTFQISAAPFLHALR